MRRPPLFSALLILLGLLLVLLAGQVLGLLNYDQAVAWGLQEPAEAIGPGGVVVNQAFCLADTVFYTPLVLLAMVGLWQRRRWAVSITAACLGITIYWPLVALVMLQRLPGTAGTSFVAPAHYVLLLVATVGLALAALLWLLRDGELLHASED